MRHAGPHRHALARGEPERRASAADHACMAIAPDDSVRRRDGSFAGRNRVQCTVSRQRCLARRQQPGGHLLPAARGLHHRLLSRGSCPHGIGHAREIAAGRRDLAWLMPTFCLRRRRELPPPDERRTASTPGHGAPSEPPAQRLPPPHCARTRPQAGWPLRVPTRSTVYRARPSSSRRRRALAPRAAAHPSRPLGPPPRARCRHRRRDQGIQQCA